MYALLDFLWLKCLPSTVVLGNVVCSHRVVNLVNQPSPCLTRYWIQELLHKFTMPRGNPPLYRHRIDSNVEPGVLTGDLGIRIEYGWRHTYAICCCYWGYAAPEASPIHVSKIRYVSKRHGLVVFSHWYFPLLGCWSIQVGQIP